MTETHDTALGLTIEVAVSVDRAFEVFTKEFDRIKPREHNLLGEAIAETVLEPRAGGRLYDRGVNGATCDWGRVLAFDPPRRLLLACDELDLVECELLEVDRPFGDAEPTCTTRPLRRTVSTAPVVVVPNPAKSTTTSS